MIAFDEDPENLGRDEDDSETIFVGDKMFQIRTSVLEEKATACQMLCCYADELKEGFLPYVKQVTDVLVPLLKFYFHHEVYWCCSNAHDYSVCVKVISAELPEYKYNDNHQLNGLNHA